MTQEDREKLIGQRVAIWSENRKCTACHKEQLRQLASSIEKFLQEPVAGAAFDAICQYGRAPGHDATEILRLDNEQERLSSFLAEQGICL